MKPWKRLLRQARSFKLEGDHGFVYLVADPHLGETGARFEKLLAQLEGLEQPRLIVFLGDLFKVWLGPPRFWGPRQGLALKRLAALREKGVALALVQGNREFFLPRTPQALAKSGLPFTLLAPEALVLEWGGKRWGFTHGDLANRQDRRYLRWRAIARSRWFQALFGLMPPWVARRVAANTERSLAATNREIKVDYPADELEAFAQALLAGADGFFIGHFHRSGEVVPPQGGGKRLVLVPDWLSTHQLMRLDAQGNSLLLAPEPH